MKNNELKKYWYENWDKNHAELFLNNIKINDHFIDFLTNQINKLSINS